MKIEKQFFTYGQEKEKIKKIMLCALLIQIKRHNLFIFLVYSPKLCPPEAKRRPLYGTRVEYFLNLWFVFFSIYTSIVSRRQTTP